MRFFVARHPTIKHPHRAMLADEIILDEGTDNALEIRVALEAEHDRTARIPAGRPSANNTLVPNRVNVRATVSTVYLSNASSDINSTRYANQFS